MRPPTKNSPNDPHFNGASSAYPHVPYRGLRRHGRVERPSGSGIGTQYTVPDFWGEALYPGKERKAAALCFGLIQNHPFIDGNKRIGVHLCDVFLEVNGVKLEYTDDDLVQLGLSVADGSWKTPDILAWIVRHQIW